MNPRRGAALLLSMVALVLVTGVLASLFALHGERTRLHAVEAREREVIALLREAEELAARWCAEQGAEMVLAPEDTHAGLVILDDAFPRGGREYRVTIQVFDGTGGVPAARARAPQPLSGWRPMGWGDTVISRPGDPVTGDADVLERVAVGNKERYPATAGSVRRPDALLPLALWLMPHSQGEVNVHTLPPELLGDLFRALGREDAEDLLERRRVGERVTAEELGRHVTARLLGIRLEVETDRWQCLITVRVAGRERRWWTVLRRDEEHVRKVQRHAAG